ncbi:hypothetical protein [Burkholderia sp. TSV86]|uniref:hypothetical protein n=1 Tax=Burkholderia sp. TSV86 TaxID=1385594 RepID=UPI0012E36037|nr:hypothetical protein [Burkholderia sp. TSV86]
MVKLSAKPDAGSDAHRQVTPIDVNGVCCASIFQHLFIDCSHQKNDQFAIIGRHRISPKNQQNQFNVTAPPSAFAIQPSNLYLIII